MTLICDNIIQKFAINPNKEIILPFDNDTSDDNDGEEEDMDTSSITNLWDSLQIEMCAEFEKIKVSLGDLKKIQEGAVVDISSVYNNKVSLKVGEQVVADGELVIVNDRYGVKVTNVAANDVKSMIMGDMAEGVAPQMAGGAAQPTAAEPAAAADGDEFDYSDFDLDE